MDLDIKEIRKKMGLTQLEFGKLLGVSDQTVSNWEISGHVPTPIYAKIENLLKEKTQKRDATDHVGRILDQMEQERSAMDADRRFYQSQIQQERDRYDRLFALFEAMQKEKVTVKV